MKSDLTRRQRDTHHHGFPLQGWSRWWRQRSVIILVWKVGLEGITTVSKEGGNRNQQESERLAVSDAVVPLQKSRDSGGIANAKAEI